MKCIFKYSDKVPKVLQKGWDDFGITKIYVHITFAEWQGYSIKISKQMFMKLIRSDTVEFEYVSIKWLIRWSMTSLHQFKVKPLAWSALNQKHTQYSIKTSMCMWAKGIEVHVAVKKQLIF